jgi:branched-chain amino acid aminotransferase/4-amino-4-deoxychorismate lyase
MTDISLEDRGFTLGHGLFETVLWADDALYYWDAHLERLDRGCQVLGLPSPQPEAMHRAALVALEAAGRPERAAVRLNWSAGPGARGLDPPTDPHPVLTATAAAVATPKGGATLVIARGVRRNDRSPAARLKSLSYLDNVLARAEARETGADEALMLNTGGEIACAAAANVFWVEGDRLCTPALDCGVLDGIMRAKVLESASRGGLEAREIRADSAKIHAAEAIFLTNSLIGLRPVGRLDGKTFAPGAAISRLSDMLAAFV